MLGTELDPLNTLFHFIPILQMRKTETQAVEEFMYKGLQSPLFIIASGPVVTAGHGPTSYPSIHFYSFPYALQ